MSFATEIKKLSTFLKEQGFLTVPQNIRGMRSWVKELDGENLVYLYICVKQDDGSSQSGHLIVSPPRNNDDGWERTALAFGIPLDENWDLETGFFDKYINRLTNLLQSTACLKDAVINEMRNPGEIATAGINTARELALREMRVLQAFHQLRQAKDFSELCRISQNAWFKQKEIYNLDAESAEKYLKPYADEIIMEYIDSYTSGLSMILATYSAFR